VLHVVCKKSSSERYAILYIFCMIIQIIKQLCISGTKIDLREDKEALGMLSEQGMSPIRREQGQKLANKVRAVRYMECSALTQRGLKQVGKLSKHWLLDDQISKFNDVIKNSYFSRFLMKQSEPF
jgi:GTPase SAR1 family protein